MVDDDADFRDPSIGIHKVYTRSGDGGTTSLVGGQRVPKDDPRIEAYGTVDELLAVLGLCVVEAEDPNMAETLQHVQQRLFNLGSLLATLPEDVGDSQPRIRQSDIDDLEAIMDDANQHLPPLTSFVLSGGSRLNGLLHLARTVCRRAERRALALEGCDREVAYLNRLSDYLFVASRQAAALLGHDEVTWDPNIA